MIVRSYYAVLTAKPGTWLLGGVRRLESSRFETRTQAEDYGTAMAQPNLATVEIRRSTHVPDIMAAETGHTGGHVCHFGPFQRSRMAGTLHRVCQVPGCRLISLDGDED